MPSSFPPPKNPKFRSDQIKESHNQISGTNQKSERGNLAFIFQTFMAEPNPIRKPRQSA